MSGRVGEGGFGDRLADLMGVAAGDQADVVPGVEGFAGVTDVASGVLAGGQLEPPAGLFRRMADSLADMTYSRAGRVQGLMCI